MLNDVSLLSTNGSLLRVALFVRRFLEVSSVSDLIDDLGFLALLDELANHLVVVTATLSCLYDNVGTSSSTHC